MQFFNTVYLAVKQSRPLIQKCRISVPSVIQNHALRQSCMPFSSQPSDEQNILSNLPEKPKRPVNAYIRFVQTVEPMLNKEFPNLKRTEKIKVASELFKKADKETILRLQNEFIKEQKEYDVKIAKYNSMLTDEQKAALVALKVLEKKDKERRRTRKINKETNKPKRPLNPYMLYAQERRASEPPASDVTEWSKKISTEWKNLPEEEKKKYSDQFAQLLKQYEDNLSKWKDSLEGTEYSYLVEKPTESEETSPSTKSKSKVSKKTVSSAQKGKVPQNKK